MELDYVNRAESIKSFLLSPKRKGRGNSMKWEFATMGSNSKMFVGCGRVFCVGVSVVLVFVYTARTRT